MRTQGEEFSLLTELAIKNSNNEIDQKMKINSKLIKQMCIEKQWDN